MEPKWMAVFPNMNWYEADFEKKGKSVDITLLKPDEKLKGKITAENDETKVIRVALDDGRQIDLADFNVIDDFFENNHINFKNRKGLHREIRRYIDFSIS